MTTDTTREKIKAAARRLFATRGLDGVSIRDIAKASGQKSSGAVNYHFRSREELIKEIIRDVQRAAELRRVERIDAIEAAGGPRSLREVIEVLVDEQALDAASHAQDEHGLRFMHSVMVNRRELYFDAIRGGADAGTRRCIAHMVRLAGPLPPALIRQRLHLAISHLFAAAVAREAARSNRPGVERGSLWGHPVAKSNLVDTVVAILCAPASPETLALLATVEAEGAAAVPDEADHHAASALADLR